MLAVVVTILSIVVAGLVAYIAMRPRSKPVVVQQPVYVVRDEPRIYWDRPRWGERRHHRRRHDHFVGRTEEGTTLDTFFASPVAEVPQAVPEVPQAVAEVPQAVAEVPQAVAEDELIPIDDVQAFEDGSGNSVEGFANMRSSNKILVGVTITAVVLGLCVAFVPKKAMEKVVKKLTR